MYHRNARREPFRTSSGLNDWYGGRADLSLDGDDGVDLGGGEEA
jgi:hypothetical protein